MIGITTSGPTVGKRDGQTEMDGPIRCSSLTLQREEHQSEHGKLVKQ
jgi:hypothetical protein